MGAGCVPSEPQGWGHVELEVSGSLLSSWPREQARGALSPVPLSLLKSGSVEAFPRGSLGRFEHRTKRAQPPGLNLSALLPAHQPAPRCPPFRAGLLSASVYHSSETGGGAEQMTPRSRQGPIPGLSDGQTRDFGTGEEVGQTSRFTWER